MYIYIYIHDIYIYIYTYIHIHIHIHLRVYISTQPHFFELHGQRASLLYLPGKAWGLRCDILTDSQQDVFRRSHAKPST